eukprot:CAMPEP_0185499842 /NCGR_PEP_ID=MMETSP1366-20130426/22961_1 /TAXON_ID=38817 /ORGANISM="Gephyrocapsa oceanica, Strain RCC1303" /LENGTH=64 /DNA_ID=CAMNT_0028109115 /DNA_START=19 /DNA_END=209 /DNA_ORIENTATION=-
MWMPSYDSYLRGRWWCGAGGAGAVASGAAGHGAGEGLRATRRGGGGASSRLLDIGKLKRELGPP